MLFTFANDSFLYVFAQTKVVNSYGAACSGKTKNH